MGYSEPLFREKQIVRDGFVNVYEDYFMGNMMESRRDSEAVLSELLRPLYRIHVIAKPDGTSTPARPDRRAGA